MDWREVARRLRNLPRASYGTTLAHFGLGVTVLGIVATSAWRQEAIVAMAPGDKAQIAGYELTFQGVAPAQGPNYREQVGLFEVSRGGQPVTRLAPSKRRYEARQMTTSEAGIHAGWRGDLYAVIGDPKEGETFSVRLYFNPLVRLIWIGTLIMFAGGLTSLSDRRLRVGAPRRVRHGPVTAPAE